MFSQTAAVRVKIHRITKRCGDYTSCMATHAAVETVSLEQYLHSSYHPDREYVDGEVVERNLGEKDHSLLQAFLTSWFYGHRREWNIMVLPEQRVQTSANFRVPDVTLVRREDDFERWVKKAPLLCVEIQSPEDRMSRTLIRLEEYRRMGIENIWVLDPEERTAWTYNASGLALATAERLEIAESPIYLPLAELWAELD